MPMTSRERVLAAIAHEETDRVPIDLGSSRSTGINAIAYNNLKKHLGFGGETTVFDIKQCLALPDDDVLQRFGVDVVILPRLVPSVGLAIDRYKEGELPQNAGKCLLSAYYDPRPLKDGSLGLYNAQGQLIAKRPPSGLYYEECFNPLADALDESDIDDLLTLPSISDEELKWQKERARYLYEHTEYAISGATSTSLFEKGLKDFGYENYMCLLLAEPELAEYYLDKLTDAYVVMMERYLDAVGDYVQIVQNNDDFGSQTGMMISPELYRKYFKPRHAKINEAIRKKCPNVHISLHSCGSIFPIIGDIIESGYDILNPLQKECDGMNPCEIKKQFGKNVTIWGGALSTQTTMTKGSIDDIVNEAKEMIKVYAPGGGFVYSQIHNIQADISPEKIISFFDTGRQFGVPSYFH